MAFLDDTGVTSLVAKIKAKIDSLNVVNSVSGKTGDVSLEASDIESGTFDTARIPSLAASKITSGIFSAARLPSATTSAKGGVIVGSGLSVSFGTLSAPVMTGATASANGAAGIVPAPASGDQEKLLKGDGTWGTIPIATTSHAGLISAQSQEWLNTLYGTQNIGVYRTLIEDTDTNEIISRIGAVRAAGSSPSPASLPMRRKLWENPDTTVNFGATTITLADAVDNYLFWYIDFFLSTSVQDKVAPFVIIGKQGIRASFAGSASNSNRGNSRDVEVDSTGTQLTFSSNYYNGSATNANMIPHKVFGFFRMT